MTFTRAQVEASPDLKKAWQQGHLDARCLSCGSTMAATSRCYRCRGELEYREHLPSKSPKNPDLPHVKQWCELGVTRQPDPSNPRTGVSATEYSRMVAERKALEAARTPA